jgi:hypothetical protein
MLLLAEKIIINFFAIHMEMQSLFNAVKFLLLFDNENQNFIIDIDLKNFKFYKISIFFMILY